MGNMKQLREIKQGENGHGLLIEPDGYISMMDKENKSLMESITSQTDNNKWFVPQPFVVHAVFQKYGKKNANGRIYPEDILRKQVETYQKKIQQRSAYGELNHPQDSVIDLGRIAINIIELHWEGCTLVGQLEIPTTKGFRESGICSSMGDQLAQLLLSNLKVGVSSRGIGSVSTVNGNHVVGDDFELVCWDAVSDPSTPGAWIDQTKENLDKYVEDVQRNTSNFKTKYEKISKWLNNN